MMELMRFKAAGGEGACELVAEESRPDRDLHVFFVRPWDSAGLSRTVPAVPSWPGQLQLAADVPERHRAFHQVPTARARRHHTDPPSHCGSRAAPHGMFRTAIAAWPFAILWLDRPKCRPMRTLRLPYGPPDSPSCRDLAAAIAVRRAHRRVPSSRVVAELPRDPSSRGLGRHSRRAARQPNPRAVAIAIDDRRTRPVPHHCLLPPLIRRLERAGVPPGDILLDHRHRRRARAMLRGSVC